MTGRQDKQLRQMREKARQELFDAGAVLEKREDRHGETKSGWWQDGVWLGPTNDPCYALTVMKGG